ncbi:MAG: hypothetical protein QM791_07240 [Ferruginibacter sp.]
MKLLYPAFVITGIAASYILLQNLLILLLFCFVPPSLAEVSLLLFITLKVVLLPLAAIVVYRTARHNTGRIITLALLLCWIVIVFDLVLKGN